MIDYIAKLKELNRLADKLKESKSVVPLLRLTPVEEKEEFQEGNITILKEEDNGGNIATINQEDTGQHHREELPYDVSDKEVPVLVPAKPVKPKQVRPDNSYLWCMKCRKFVKTINNHVKSWEVKHNSFRIALKGTCPYCSSMCNRVIGANGEVLTGKRE